MLAAGGGYTRDNTSTEGDLSMMILCDNGNFQPFWRVQSWTLEHLTSIDCVVGDLRWAMMALALRSLRSLWVLGRDQFVLLLRRAASRPARDADSMVATGRG
jgi:hypothetical protein